MNELINLVVQKTGLSPEDAQKAVATVMDFLKSRLPAPIASHIDGFLAGGTEGAAGGIEGQIGDLLRSKLGGVLGQ